MSIVPFICILETWNSAEMKNKTLHLKNHRIDSKIQSQTLKLFLPGLQNNFCVYDTPVQPQRFLLWFQVEPYTCVKECNKKGSPASPPTSVLSSKILT